MKLEDLRTLLKNYDEGILTLGEVECWPVFKVMEEVRERLQKGEDTTWVTLGCFAYEREPVEGEVIIGSQSITIRPKRG